jgi:hypothetical protein
MVATASTHPGGSGTRGQQHAQQCSRSQRDELSHHLLLFRCGVLNFIAPRERASNLQMGQILTAKLESSAFDSC